MSTQIDATAVARGTRSLFNLLSPEQVKQLQHLAPDVDLDARATYLAARANEGELTPEEYAESLGYVEANSVLAILRSAARQQDLTH